jgi:ketosteroid isomerase-like protein
MITTVSQFRNELADREAIRDCLYRYSRGVDRCDEEMLRSVYWEDALDDHVLFSGTREELIAWVIPTLRAMDQSMHSINNVLIRLHGDKAHVESYYYGYHRLRDGSTHKDSVQSGRYLDHFERRNDEWRILRRRVVVDWFRDYADAADWERGPLGRRIELGGRHPMDISYSILNLT